MQVTERRIFYPGKGIGQRWRCLIQGQQALSRRPARGRLEVVPTKGLVRPFYQARQLLCSAAIGAIPYMRVIRDIDGPAMVVRKAQA